VKRGTTIRNVKERIRSSTGVRRDNIRLCFLGTVLGVTGDEANSDEEQAKVYDSRTCISVLRVWCVRV
jgi:hypothetical protein